MTLNRFVSLLLFCFFSSSIYQVQSLDNGLVRLPPMGWLAWARYACNTDCDQYPDDCISENLFYKQAELLAKDYLQYGYEYINIDDCWSELQRDNVTHDLVADRKRFPNGIKKLSDYVHSKGLKMGIYSDIGTKTCAGYPGHQNAETKDFYFEQDAQLFAKWGIDYLKVDGCYAETNDYPKTYPALGQALNKSGKSIVYSCSWPAYKIENKDLDFNEIAVACNVWRNYDDIMFSWQSVLTIIDFFSKHQDEYVEIHGPNQWFDPDMIIAGNNGLSIEQMKAQLAIWSIWSAPLFMSNDLSKISPEEKSILTNKHVIAIDQDEEGILGRRVYKSGNFEVFLKPISPITIKGIDHWQYAIVYFNRNVLGSAKYYSKSLDEIIIGFGKTRSKRYNPLKDLKNLAEQPVEYRVLDLFADAAEIDRIKITTKLRLKVDVGGAVRMVKLVPVLSNSI